jgi:hypothetical protein
MYKTAYFCKSNLISKYCCLLIRLKAQQLKYFKKSRTCNQNLTIEFTLYWSVKHWKQVEMLLKIAIIPILNQAPYSFKMLQVLIKHVMK